MVGDERRGNARVVVVVSEVAMWLYGCPSSGVTTEEWTDDEADANDRQHNRIVREKVTIFDL